MKEQTVFKVVAVDGQRLISSAQRQYCIIYIPKVWIEPRIGKIFVFKSQVDARSFIRKFLSWGNSTIQIWKAIGKNVTKIDFIACASHVTEFWDGRFPNKKFPEALRVVPPDGTLIADEIKMIEKVT
jgi:hypothetical protein